MLGKGFEMRVTGGTYELIEGIMLVTVCVITNYAKKKVALRDAR